MLLSQESSRMNKRVILARPHPLIVDHMRAFLSTNGYMPTVLHDMSELQAFASGQPAGIVVSTSVVGSDSKMLFRDVLRAIRDSLPSTPILIPTLVPFASLQQTFPDLRLLSVEACTQHQDDLGSQECLVVAQREDFIDPVRRAHAGTIIRSHFRWPLNAPV